MVVRAIGYRGVPVAGVPFHDALGIIPNDDGRVTASDGEPMPGLYVVGWAKRGPTGLIGTNKGDSQATVDRMLEDLPSIEPAADSGDVAALLEHRRVRFVTFDDWKLLDAVETERGAARGRVREKIVEPEAMLDVIREARAGQRT
jgi:ferredoxin--NADP+ reductase